MLMVGVKVMMMVGVGLAFWSGNPKIRPNSNRSTRVKFGLTGLGIGFGLIRIRNGRVMGGDRIQLYPTRVRPKLDINNLMYIRIRGCFSEFSSPNSIIHQIVSQFRNQKKKRDSSSPPILSEHSRIPNILLSSLESRRNHSLILPFPMINLQFQWMSCSACMRVEVDSYGLLDVYIYEVGSQLVFRFVKFITNFIFQSSILLTSPALLYLFDCFSVRLTEILVSRNQADNNNQIHAGCRFD